MIQPHRHGQLEILYVEDNEAHASLVRRSLEDSGIRASVRHVSDGEQALDYLFDEKPTDRPARPDLLLLDLRLPRVDGLEVLRELRRSEEYRDLPVVVLSTSRRAGEMELARKGDIAGYFVKPLDMSRFSAMLAKLGLHSGHVRETGGPN